MEIKLLRKLFQEGLLVAARIEPALDMPDQFTLKFTMTNGGEAEITKVRNSSDVKIYKRLNGALLDAREIGFVEVTIRFS